MVIAGAILLGCVVIAWSVYFVGRRIARVLFGIGVILETDDAVKSEMRKRIDRL